ALRAMRLRTQALKRLGRRAQALEAYEEILTRFGDAEGVELRDGVAAALADKAVLLAELGRSSEAMSVFDEALALIAPATEPPLRDRTVNVLLSKSDVLARMERVEEALVAYDSTATAYQAARAAGGETGALWSALLALFYKVELLCDLDRGEEARQVGA